MSSGCITTFVIAAARRYPKTAKGVPNEDESWDELLSAVDRLLELQNTRHLTRVRELRRDWSEGGTWHLTEGAATFSCPLSRFRLGGPWSAHPTRVVAKVVRVVSPFSGNGEQLSIGGDVTLELGQGGRDEHKRLVIPIDARTSYGQVPRDGRARLWSDFVVVEVRLRARYVNVSRRPCSWVVRPLRVHVMEP